MPTHWYPGRSSYRVVVQLFTSPAAGLNHAFRSQASEEGRTRSLAGSFVLGYGYDFGHRFAMTGNDDASACFYDAEQLGKPPIRIRRRDCFLHTVSISSDIHYYRMAQHFAGTPSPWS